MTTRQLLEELGEIDDRLILRAREPSAQHADADKVRAPKPSAAGPFAEPAGEAAVEIVQTRPRPAGRLLAVAAALAILVGLGALVYRFTQRAGQSLSAESGEATEPAAETEALCLEVESWGVYRCAIEPDPLEAVAEQIRQNEASISRLRKALEDAGVPVPPGEPPAPPGTGADAPAPTEPADPESPNSEMLARYQALVEENRNLERIAFGKAVADAAPGLVRWTTEQCCGAPMEAKAVQTELQQDLAGSWFLKLTFRVPAGKRTAVQMLRPSVFSS